MAGVLIVCSKITHPDFITPDLLTQWYKDEHLPDMAALEGVRSASLFSTSEAPNSGVVDRPFLAVYHLEDVAAFQASGLLKTVRLHSDMLSNPSRFIFDVADFEAKHYVLVGEEGEVESAGGRQDAPQSLIMTRFDSEDPPQEASAYALVSLGGLRPDRSRLYRISSGAAGDATGETPSSLQYLGLHEFDRQPQLVDMLESSKGLGLSFTLKAHCNGGVSR